VRIGLALPHYDFSLPGGGSVSFTRTAEVARRAEELGFDSVWISDHFFLSLARYGGTPEPQGSLEPLTTLAALAVTTGRVRLGTLVLCAPFRHPVILAKTASAIDLLSGGRLDLGIGAGWYGEEFEAFGVPFGTVGERFLILEETLRVLVALFGEQEPVTFEGRRFRLRGAYNRPRPAQRPRPPLWVGSKGGERSLRIAARHADGWNTVWRWAPDAYEERVRRAREICEEEGRDPSTLRLSIGLYSIVGEDRRDLAARIRAAQRWMPDGALGAEGLEGFSLDTLTGTPERVLERIAAFAALGVEEIVVSPAPIPFAVPDVSVLDVWAERIIPEARAL
jgi:probable F420-dependent oxidoreductase